MARSLRLSSRFASVLGARACVTLLACGASSHQGGDDDHSVGDGGADADANGDADCVDLDGDGAGVGAECVTMDCDETDPTLTVECGQGCDAHPERTGCPCPVGLVVACYTGPPGTAGNASCEGGLRTCALAGTWAGCEGQTLPGSPEEVACDQIDEDCDGAVDDGLENECGDCNPMCSRTCVGRGCDVPFVGNRSHRIALKLDGSITMSPDRLSSVFAIWVPNTGQGTPWIDVGSEPPRSSPVDLDTVLAAEGVDPMRAGRFVEIEAALQAIDRLNSPTVFSISLAYTCGDA